MTFVDLPETAPSMRRRRKRPRRLRPFRELTQPLSLPR
ncbi:hypothetical protein MPEAHAMD_4484 [Methylobacterium frigidaeris]|uniref:Uncharacterized protein n=1 Tax=Methylobacterium frigidaeris TaxID=2038277 RepID=A0AA37HEK4_9HYPH|nr:hypothetical protein MPEAHAMD_4484 [Methylobacterium frigidaeris]